MEIIGDDQMIYPYECTCGNTFEVIKSVADIDLPENCPKCNNIGTRYISRTHFYGASGWDTEYNHGLGCVTKNRQHAEKITKARGLISVGNENPDKIMSSNAEKREREIDANFEESFAATKHHLMNSREG